MEISLDKLFKPLADWQRCWRMGFVPNLERRHLLALKKALEEDDNRLMQGDTTMPPPLSCMQDWPVESACAMGYCGWQGDELNTVGQVEEFFAQIIYKCNQTLGEPAASRHFLNWFDDTPRDEMRKELLAEVELALSSRISLTETA